MRCFGGDASQSPRARWFMSRLTPEQRAILSLREEIPEGRMEYLTKGDAYDLLKKWTNQDFGYDADKWEKWIELCEQGRTVFIGE